MICLQSGLEGSSSLIMTNNLSHLFQCQILEDFLTAFLGESRRPQLTRTQTLRLLNNMMNHEHGYIPAVDACNALMPVSSDKCTMPTCALPRC